MTPKQQLKQLEKSLHLLKQAGNAALVEQVEATIRDIREDIARQEREREREQEREREREDRTPPRPPERSGRGATLKWDAPAIKWLRAQIEAGETIGQLCAVIRTSPVAIHHVCRKNGLPPPPQRDVDVQPPVTRGPQFSDHIGNQRFEDMPAETLRRELGQVPRTKSHPIGPLTKLTPRRPIGRALDISPWC